MNQLRKFFAIREIIPALIFVVVVVCVGQFLGKNNHLKGVEFMVFGDSGTGSFSQRILAKEMFDLRPSYIFHTGDIAYPSGTAKQLKENFSEIYRKILLSSKFYPSPGNHDYINDNLDPYLKLFNPPKVAASLDGQGRYYSVDLNNVHLVSLDTNISLDVVSEDRSDDMLDWLEKDLSQAPKSKWIIVFFHHSPYTSGTTHGEDKRVQELIVPILEKYNVNLVFSGHEHNYERTCLMLRGKCGEQGITYIVTGGGGADLYEFGKPKPYSIARSVSHHFVVFNTNKCELQARAINLEGVIIDSFTLNRCE